MTESAIITPQGVSASSQTIDNSYVPPDDRVLDPSTLKDSLLNRMPSPTGWRLLILPYRGKGLTSGGIALSKQTIDEDQIQTVVGYVLKQGPLAYKDKEKFVKPWCKEGQFVVIGRYAGARFKTKFGEHRIINDDEVIATIEHPDDVYSV